MDWHFWRGGHDGEGSLAFGLAGRLALWDDGGALVLRAMVSYGGRGQLCTGAFGLYWWPDDADRVAMVQGWYGGGLNNG